jgi:hypothetical protein
MPSLPRLDEQQIEYGKRVVRILSNEAFSFPVLYDPQITDRELERWEKGKVGYPESVKLNLRVHKAQASYTNKRHEALDWRAAILKWRDDGTLPKAGMLRDIVLNIRRCRHKGCARFFLVTSRPTRVFCSSKCNGNYRALKSMNKKKREIREGKLKGVRTAVRKFKNRPDWKERAAHRARVTPNFISYAIRRKEVEHR